MSETRHRLPGFAGWEYALTSTPGERVTLAGYRPDTPAALPLVTAEGESLPDAMVHLAEAVQAWDGARG